MHLDVGSSRSRLLFGLACSLHGKNLVSVQVNFRRHSAPFAQILWEVG
jgi:hypothetical protein